MDLCSELGVPLAPTKTVAPCHVLTFLGITLDAVRQDARLPEDKLLKGRLLLADFQRKRKITLKELQSLLGVLNCFCTVVPGRAFLRHLLGLTVGLQKPHHHIRWTIQAKLDLQVWQDFLTQFNGKSFFIDDNFLTGDFLQLYTDASGSIGFGAVYGSEWFYGLWPSAWRSYHISVLELYPIMAAVQV